MLQEPPTKTSCLNSVSESTGNHRIRPLHGQRESFVGDQSAKAMLGATRQREAKGQKSEHILYDGQQDGVFELIQVVQTDWEIDALGKGS